jgi:F0F1-type ATP synthase delta subunit
MDRSQAPLQQFGTSGRYATALYVAATKAGNLKTVEGELEQVREATSETTRARGSLLQRQTTETDGAFTISFVPAHEFGGEGS